MTESRKRSIEGREPESIHFNDLRSFFEGSCCFNLELRNCGRLRICMRICLRAWDEALDLEISLTPESKFQSICVCRSVYLGPRGEGDQVGRPSLTSPQGWSQGGGFFFGQSSFRCG
ncbi:hypothetical protein NPIL_590971 [Nephila pilipes]|uniref:Uncharacterized protein n=1 Tax=Nephila pilipes TaxID=299642 RepID=A0A8X6M677_NEPPI|nr:hypothetical protein NPIL_590971 [Nephila pilipes]